MTTPREIADWMLDHLDEEGKLLQVEAAASIRERFGLEFVYFDPDGHLAISRRVLYQFRKITEGGVVWVTHPRGGFWEGAHWRRRELADGPGRTQHVNW